MYVSIYKDLAWVCIVPRSRVNAIYLIYLITTFLVFFL